MARARRQKADKYCYHVMSKSISEVKLFRCDDDKSRYLAILKKKVDKFHCRILAYCLMDTHVHLFVDPCGFDISTLMHCINTAYVMYYNKRYDRHGHLFGGRFASFIVYDDKYSLNLFAYIHNNAKDLPGFEGKEEFYRYSSYGIYTGARKDVEKLIDTSFLLDYFSKDTSKAIEQIRLFTRSMKNTQTIKEIEANIMKSYTQNEYQSSKQYIVRDRDPEAIVKNAAKLMGEKIIENIRAKFSRKCSKLRAFISYAMRVLCGFKYTQICKYIGNMSVSGISRLCCEGFKLVNTQDDYREAFKLLINYR